ncbi:MULTISPECIES: DNA-processing protein DprA [unclassified Novosphingobium]|uniref:DNA-processing protein DprA n=1 Tax=unclassified Novosphingobium TaxID=2644732 RepID=UPI00149415DC|nr:MULTISPECIES: DNA-processing protein DprA [unclassified Novosphingobium]MBB3357741.1 DNA processing protein [Novosphingobium sp. BK256]MBB3373595.1 DNA processing protein [Novosphingobium sp. BK280]MBB3378007.1 DNA processing protein [Novosphingobium sp. BK258]MBB3420208.1 DNA processing protein [Novosphingobium sp. BK267]MBB3447470.1 DNA processing protein [Novosphingobium sp. BK352]
MASADEAAALPLSSDEALARLRLLRSPNVGPVSYYQLLRRFGSAGAAVEALPSLAARGGARYRPADAARIAAEAARVRSLGGRYLFHDSPHYPALLAQTDTPPPILTMQGDAALLARPAVALVGARNASAGAMRLAREFGAALAAAGFAVVSGLARGVDGAAHQGALLPDVAAGGGGTIGVIAGGLDSIYPPEHGELQAQIVAQGVLLAEMPPGTEPQARHFPRRNRIIAGLCAGTVVVEAAPKSGSLITARLAAEAGREIMAIPGSPLDSRSQGCNQLIREGAILVQSPADVIELLESFTGTPRSTFHEAAAPVALDSTPADDAPAEIAALLGTAPVGVDELVRLSGAPAGSVQLALIELELAGRLLRHAGGRVSLA